MSFFSILFSQWTLYAGVILYMLYKWSMRPYSFFQEKGIPFKKPWPVFGNFGGMSLRQETLHDMILNNYNEFKNNR